MEWYYDFDFDENPFSTDPRENHDKLIEMQDIVDEMLYRIRSGSMMVIEGPEGHGKTSLLMLAARKFGGRKKVVYIDCMKLDDKLNITRILQERYGFMGRLLNRKPKNMIVLMDNVEKLSKANTERLKYYFDQNYISSIIFTTTNYKSAKFSDSLKDRIGTRVMKTPDLSEYDAIEIVRERIGDNELFNDEIIKKVFNMSKNSPELLLSYCEELAKHAAEKSRNRVQMADLKILSDKK